MKPYWLFGGERYYPAGGFADLVAQHDDLFILMAFAKQWTKGQNADWWHIVDMRTGRVVRQFAHPDVDLSRPFGQAQRRCSGCWQTTEQLRASGWQDLDECGMCVDTSLVPLFEEDRNPERVDAPPETESL